MTTSNRATYARLRASRQCVDCRDSLQPSDGVRCTSCRDRVRLRELNARGEQLGLEPVNADAAGHDAADGNATEGMIYGRRCECGNLKGRNDEGCARCMHLDAGEEITPSKVSREIVRVLRERGPSTLREIAARIGPCRRDSDSSTVSVRNVLRRLRLMLASGRVRSYEGESWEATHLGFGGKPVRSMASPFVYALNGASEVELRRRGQLPPSRVAA